MSKKAKVIEQLTCKHPIQCDLTQQLENAVEIANLGIWQWFIETDDVFLDQKAMAITGIDVKSFNNTMAYIIDHIVHRDSKALFVESLERANKLHGVSNQVYRINHPTKDEVWIRFKSQFVHDDKGKAYMLTGVLMDVTEDIIKNRETGVELTFIKTLLETIIHPIFYKDTEYRYQYFNKAFETFLGLKAHEIMNKTVYDVANKPLADVYHDADDELMRNRGKQIYESKVQYADGSYHDVIFTKSALIDADDQVQGVVGIMQDVTSQRDTEKEIKRIYDVKDVFLKISREVHQFDNEVDFLHEILSRIQEVCMTSDIAVLLEETHNGFIRMSDHLKVVNEHLLPEMPIEESFIHHITRGREFQIVVMNESDMQELPIDDVGRTFLKHNPVKSVMIIPVAIEGRKSKFFLFNLYKADGFTEKDVSIAKYIQDELSFVLKFYYMTQEILKMSRYDGLTGLMNRGYFDDQLHRILREAEVGDMSFCVAIFDLDGLKVINDLFGHEKGDDYLILLADLLKREFKDAILGRIGGDEFAGIFTIDEIQLKDRLELIRHVFIEIVEEKTENRLHSGFSYGISKYSKDGTTYKIILRKADKNMYEYKKNHKNF